MNTMNTLVNLIRNAVALKNTDQEPQAQEIIKGIKSFPSSLGPDLLIEQPRPVESLTAAQLDLFSYPLDCMIDPFSDLVDHIPSYSDEECLWVRTALMTIHSMTAEEVRSKEEIQKRLPQVVEYNCIKNCAWDFKKRDTVIQLKIELSEAKPLRLVEVPFDKVHSSLRPILRHKGKPFQSLHITSNIKALRPYVSTCKFFILTIWVGPEDKKITESGTGYRSETFPGQSVAKDNATRVVIRPLKEQALVEALKDFETTFGQDPSSQHLVPVLMQMDDFCKL